jgi:hypothetical protein
MRNIYTALAAVSLFFGGAAATTQQLQSTSVAEIRAHQRASQARNLAARQKYEGDLKQRIATARQVHEQQRVKKDKKRADKSAYNHQRQLLIERNRANRRLGPNRDQAGPRE